MKIIKIPITEQNREVYWSRNKDKKAWEKLMSECPSMTSKEFWNNEWEEFDKEEISTHWYFIVGKPESIIDDGLPADNVIYYPHSNTLSFNWNNCKNKITQKEFDDFVNNVDRSQLPEGIKFELK